MIYSKIVSVGAYLPSKILTNEDLSKIVDTNDEWIVQRTGIRSRRIAEDMTTSDMAFEASKIALKKANLDADDIDLIVFATSTPDKKFPSSGCILQGKLTMNVWPLMLTLCVQVLFMRLSLLIL